MLRLLPLVAAGHVELSTPTDVSSLSDARLGQLLADQLRVAPAVSSRAEAEEVFALTGTTMLHKPKAVLLAVMDGVDGPGVPLETACASAQCVLHSLVSQAEGDTLAEQLEERRESAVTAVSSCPHMAAAAGYGHAHLIAHDRQRQQGIYELTSGVAPTATKLDLINIAQHVSPLRPLADDFSVDDSAITIAMGSHRVTLDAGNGCVRTMLGEALAIHGLAPSDKESHLYVVAPRGAACMKKDFGHSSSEAAVASALLEAAVRHAEAKLGAWAVKVRTGGDGAVVLAPTLVAASRRLAHAGAVELGLVGAQIANYHIYTWSSVTIILGLFAAVYAIVAMTNERDPLLYAKFRPEVDGSRR